MPTVKLIVGHEQRLFEFDEQRLCWHCPFFSNAFEKHFIEAQTKTITLPEDDPKRFEELSTWLSGESISPGETWLSLATTWLFADKYHIDQLQNTVIDAIYAKFAAHEEGINISYSTLDYIAENTSQSPNSPLRRIFADMLTNGISLQQLPSRMDQLPVEFLQDMVLALKRTVSTNSPTTISLLTDPIMCYYSSSNKRKSNARPASPPPIEARSSGIYCDGLDCRQKSPQEPIKGLMHICTNHNLKLCHDCRHSHHGHRKKLFTFSTAPYRDFVTGESVVIDGYINDSGFYCDGPKCDPENKRLTHESWALMSGDRYHCLECDNLDFCNICVRGPLQCKEEGHSLLRIRPTFAKTVPLTKDINIKQRQERVARQACWRCASTEHLTGECEERPALAEDVEMED